MAAWGRRILAGLLLIPPFTPIGILLWYWARRSDKKARTQDQAADDLAAIRQELENQD